MGVNLRFNPLATTDLQEIKAYIAEENPTAAINTVRHIIAKIEELIDFPEMGSLLAAKIQRKSNYRYLVYEQYLIFYIYEDGFVSVQRILHARRDYISLLMDED